MLVKKNNQLSTEIVDLFFMQNQKLCIFETPEHYEEP